MGLTPAEMFLTQTISNTTPAPDGQPGQHPRLIWLRSRLPDRSTWWEIASLFGFMVFFLLYGVTPIFGGAGMGLVGADEPRYAQIAHEMLHKLDSAHTLREQLSACVTPYLYGRAWLEKPALYYWRAMYVFKEFGV